MASRSELEDFLDTLLEPEKFRDYGPNGLQVEGRPQVHRLITGVTASLALIEAAIHEGADAILVHHGLFWRALRDECVSPRTYRNSASQADQTPVRRTLRAMAM